MIKKLLRKLNENTHKISSQLDVDWTDYVFFWGVVLLILNGLSIIPLTLLFGPIALLVCSAITLFLSLVNVVNYGLGSWLIKRKYKR